MRVKQFLVSMLFFMLTISFFITPLLSIEAYQSSPQLMPIQPKLSAEQNTIDSFDINPAQRYNITTSGTTLKTSIDQGNLKIQNFNNGSTDNSYTASRPLSKTDSKVEYRYLNNGVTVGSNTSEYFRDQLGNPMTFDSSTQGWVADGSATVSQLNGQLKIITTSTFTGVKLPYTFLTSYISSNVYTNLSYALICSSSLNFRIYFNYITSTGSNLGGEYIDSSCTSGTNLINLYLPSWIIYVIGENVLFNQIRIETTTSGTNTFYLDNIQLLGSYNYPTMNLYPNNWGFDSSKEYFYDVAGNQVNFQDGTTEGFTQLPAIIPSGSILFGTGTLAGGASLTSSAVGPVTGATITKTGTFSVQVTATALTGSNVDKLTLSVSTDSGGSYTGIVQGTFTSAVTVQTLSDTATRVTGAGQSLIYRLTMTYSTGTESLVITDTAETQATYSATSGTQTISNAASQYLKDITSGYYFSITRASLSITASTYKYFGVEFNSSVAITNVAVYDSAMNTICSDSTGWSAGTRYEFFCTTNPTYWTGTETNISIVFTASASAGTLFIHTINIWDTSLGNTENWTPYRNYNYVDPQGYLINHVTSVSGGITTYRSGLNIDPSIYKYVTISIKGSSTLQFGIMDTTNTHLLIPKTTITTTFQTFTFDLSQSAYWSGTQSYFYIYFYSSSGGNAPLDSVFTIDYILLTATATTTPQQPFQIGFLNPTTFQPLLNITQIYTNQTSFYWLANLYDQYGNIAAYYQSATQTSVVSGYPAVADNLYVNGFDSTSLGWKLVGTTPYLSALDSSYISNLLANLNTINFGTGTLSNTSSTTTSLTASLTTPVNSHWYKSGTFSVDTTASMGYTPATYTGIDATSLLNFGIGSLDNTTSLTTSLNSTYDPVSWYKSLTFYITVNASSTTPANYTTTNTLYLDVSTDGGSTWTLGISSAIWSNNQSAVKTLTDSSSRYTSQNKLVYRLRDVQTGNGSASLVITSTTEIQASYKYLEHFITTNTLYLDVSTTGGSTWTTGLDSFSWSTNDTAISHVFSDAASYDITNSFLEYRLRLVQTGNGTDSLQITSTTETQATYTYIPNTATENWFSLADESSSFTDGYTTTINVYISKVSIGDQLQWQIDTNADGLAECYGTLATPVTGWNTITPDTACMNTKTEINNARLSITSLGSTGEMQLNAVYIDVTHDSTEISSAGWGGYYRGKITYTLETSELSIEMDTDAGSKIFKVTYPDEFTITSQQNTFFSVGSNPLIYFQTTAPALSYGSVLLDFINAPFTESHWQTLADNTDQYWIHSPFIANIQYQGSGDIEYGLDVPLMDSATGSMFLKSSNTTFGPAAGSYAFQIFNVYMVSKNDGYLVPLVRLVIMHYYDTIVMGIFNCNSTYFDIASIILSSPTNYIFLKYLNTVASFDSQIDFNLFLTNNRQILTLQYKSTFNVNDTSANVYANDYSFNLTNLLSSTTFTTYGLTQADISNEFYLETDYYAAVNQVGSLSMAMNSFGLQTRDIFQDAIIAIVNAGGGIFAPLFQGLANALGGVLTVVFRFLAQIFNVVGLSIVSGIIAGLPTAIGTTIQPFFTSLGTTINNYLGPLLNGITSAVSTVTNAISSLAGNIASQLSGYFDNIVNAIYDLADQAAVAIWSTLVDGVNTYIYPLIESAIDVVANLVNTIWTNVVQPFLALVWSGLGWAIDTIVNIGWLLWNYFAGFIATQYNNIMPAIIRGWIGQIWDFILNLPNLAVYIATNIILAIQVYTVSMTVLIGFLYVKDKYESIQRLVNQNVNPLKGMNLSALGFGGTFPAITTGEIFLLGLLFIFGPQYWGFLGF